MFLRNLSDAEVLRQADEFTAPKDPRVHTPGRQDRGQAIALIDELAWRLERQLAQPEARVDAKERGKRHTATLRHDVRA